MITSIDFRQTALDCVAEMGQIFTNQIVKQDSFSDSNNPREIAAGAIEKSLQEIVADLEYEKNPIQNLYDEYRTLIADLPDQPSDSEIIHALVNRADWTQIGATEVLQLAQWYGTSILRNALALAEAMEIEDGELGF